MFITSTMTTTPQEGVAGVGRHAHTSLQKEISKQSVRKALKAQAAALRVKCEQAQQVQVGCMLAM